MCAVWMWRIGVTQKANEKEQAVTIVVTTGRAGRVVNLGNWLMARVAWPAYVYSLPYGLE